MTAYSGFICDVCGRPARHVERFSAQRKSGGKPHTWDVGDCCMNTPFQVMDHRQIDVTVTVRERTL